MRLKAPTNLLGTRGFSPSKYLLAFSISTGMLFNSTTTLAMGVLGAHPLHLMQSRSRHVQQFQPEVRSSRIYSVRRRGSAIHLTSSIKEKALRGHRHGKVVHERVIVYSPQNYIDKLSTEKIADGVIYRTLKGPLTINLLDIDLTNSAVKVRPIMAGDAFNQLKDVSDHVKQSHALAAVNANYFKKDGTPLGTLIVDGEWVAGPLYDRVSLGITKKGFGRVDRVKLGGSLATSNTEVPNIWINNINQPRRNGSRLVAYTRRWGSFIRLPYEGCLVALDATGRVVDKSMQELTIPWGGMVLTDSKGGSVGKLHVGDRTYMTWKTAPSNWSDVSEAVSGGPLLIKDGNLYMDLKDERFRASWTSSSIHARTAAAVTANNHLLLATIEGSHTLWDLAKFLQKLGATEALNLDGGGSTTMVVKGEAVTRAPKSAERRVASSIGVFVGEPAPHHYSTYQIPEDISQFVKTEESNVEELSTSNLASHSTITH
jgi:exopolysaccharide biosynthesis protein